MGDRTAIYTRLSVAPDGSLEKVERQEADCRALAARLGWTISEQHVYQDNNRSAWKRDRKRPGWDAMLTAVQAGQVDAIVVYHGDRLIRQPYDLELLLRIAEDKDVRLASVSGVRDLSSPDDHFILRVEAAQACRSSADTSRRVTRGWQARSERGLPGLGGRRPFGWEPDGITPRATEIRVLAEAASRMLAGQTVGGVVAWLRGTCTTSTGQQWTPRALRGVLLSPRIAGLIEQRGKTYRGAWEPVISVEDWEEIRSLYQARAEANPYPGRERRYLLSGIAECSLCGGRMRPKPTGGRNRPDSRTYCCPQCKKIGRDLVHLDEYVTGVVLGLLADPALLDQLTGPGSDPELGRQIAELERRRDQARKQLANLADHPDISVELVATSLSSFAQRIEALRARQVATTQQRLLARAAGISRDGWERLPMDIRSRIVAVLVRVEVLPTKRRGPGFDTASVRVTRRALT